MFRLFVLSVAVLTLSMPGPSVGVSIPMQTSAMELAGDDDRGKCGPGTESPEDTRTGSA